MSDGIEWIGKNNWGRYCVPSDFSTSWFTVLADRLSVWANDQTATPLLSHLTVFPPPRLKGSDGK